MITIFVRMLEVEGRVEPEQFRDAVPYERAPERRTDQNDFRPKRVDLAGAKCWASPSPRPRLSNTGVPSSITL